MRRYTTILLALLLVALVAAGCGDFETGNITSNQGGKDSTASQTVQATTVSEGEEATVGAEPLTTTEEPQKDATGSGETTTDAQSSGEQESRADSEEQESRADSDEKLEEPAASSQQGASGQQESRGSAPSFTAAPSMGGGSGNDADSIKAVRFGVHEGYERVVIDFVMGDSPASTVPEWTLGSPSGDGRLKVNLPSVSSTAVSDGSFDGSLLEQFYVVRSPEGGMFVDIFSGSAFYYRVIELSDPARLAIDFKPSGYELGFPLPARGGNTVVTSPRTGETITTPLTVSGYSRNFEAQNTTILKDPSGQVVARRSVQSNDWASTWGYFEATMEFPVLLSGEGTLMVGTESAKDGNFKGVEVPVRGGG
jgi:hypothetical protein